MKVEVWWIQRSKPDKIEDEENQQRSNVIDHKSKIPVSGLLQDINKQNDDFNHLYLFRKKNLYQLFKFQNHI